MMMRLVIDQFKTKQHIPNQTKPLTDDLTTAWAMTAMNLSSSIRCFCISRVNRLLRLALLPDERDLASGNKRIPLFQISRKTLTSVQCSSDYQALLSEEALLTCMVYVDLNPIRAGMCNTPEESDYTSIKERITPSFDLTQATDDEIKHQRLQRFDLPLKPLAQFEGNVTSQEQIGILFSLNDYLQLVDETGRIIRDDKRGAIPINLPPILERLSIDRQQWLQQSQQFEKLYASRFAKKRRSFKKKALQKTRFEWAVPLIT
jgi:hypothetical protein